MKPSNKKPHLLPMLHRGKYRGKRIDDPTIEREYLVRLAQFLNPDTKLYQPLVDYLWLPKS